MTLSPAQRNFLMVAGALAALGGLYVIYTHDRDPIKELRHVGAVERQAPESAGVWYARAQRCLHHDADTLAPSVRWFTGDTVPRLWPAEPGVYGGYTSPDLKAILLAPGRERQPSIVVHEEFHVRYGYGHPDSLFGPRAQACGIAAP